MGMLYFTHYWYWFSSVHFLSLALSPSALIGVDRDLNVPSSFSFVSNSKPSLYGYPKNIDPNKDKI
jgi:26S proteasome regulatory subunit N2